LFGNYLTLLTHHLTRLLYDRNSYYFYLAFYYTGSLFYLTNILRHFPSLFHYSNTLYCSIGVSVYWHAVLCTRCVSLVTRCTPYLEDVPVSVHGEWQFSRRSFPAVSSWRTRVSAGTGAALGPTAATVAPWSQGTRNPSASTRHCPWSLQHVHVV